MTITNDRPHAGDLAHGDATLVLDIAEIAEEQLGETEDERNLRVRYQEALHSLLWDLNAPWSEHTVAADRVLRTPRGDLDESRVAQFLDRVLRAGQSAADARHAMDRELKHAKITEARSGVASRLHALGERDRAREATPVHRGELPPAQAVPAQGPGLEPLPKRVPRPVQREPIAPPAPEEPGRVEHADEDPMWSTMQLSAIAAGGSAKGALKPETLQRLHDEGFGQTQKPGAPEMGPSAPAEFGASAIPQQRVSLVDTVTMHADEVLSGLALDDAGDGPGPAMPPFSGTGRTGAASPASGSGDDDDD